MDLLNSVIRLCVFKSSPNLIAGHIEFVVVALPEIAGQGAEGALGGEGERSSHFGFVLSPATVVRLTVVDSVLNPLRFEEP